MCACWHRERDERDETSRNHIARCRRKSPDPEQANRPARGEREDGEAELRRGFSSVGNPGERVRYRYWFLVRYYTDLYAYFVARRPMDVYIASFG